MRIRGLEGRSLVELERDIAAGARFVYFDSCISFIAVTCRRPSDVYFLPSGKRGRLRSLPYCLISLALGWWGIPWGMIYTPLSLATNLSGGCDVTAETLAWLRVNQPAA